MTYPEVEILASQVDDVVSLLADVTDEEWSRPTRLPGWTVKDLAMHVAGGARVSNEIASTDAGGREPNTDRSRWWRMPDRTAPDVIMAAAIETAGEIGNADVPGAVAQALGAFVATLRSVPGDSVVGTEWRTLRADEFAAARVLEYGVHTMDLGHALLRGERITPAAATLIAGILDTLLGETLPVGIGWDTRTYILTGMGRRALSANERYSLGPLAASFPIVA